MKCISTVLTYNDDGSLKIVCIKEDPVDYEQFNSQLTDRIGEFIGWKNILLVSVFIYIFRFILLYSLNYPCLLGGWQCGEVADIFSF